MQIGDTVKIRVRQDGPKLHWDPTGTEAEGTISHCFSTTYWVKVGTQTVKKVPTTQAQDLGSVPDDTTTDLGSVPSDTTQDLGSVPNDTAQDLGSVPSDKPIPPTPREVKLWRLLCEDLDKRQHKSALPSELGHNSHPAWELFASTPNARQRRADLWQLHSIQLIFWGMRGWCLRKGWKKNLKRLEKRYLSDEPKQLKLELKKTPGEGRQSLGEYQGVNSPLILAKARPPPLRF